MRSLVSLVVAASLFGACTPPENEAPPTHETHGLSPVTSALSRYLRAQWTEYAFRGAALVAQGDEILLRAGYGSSSANSEVPITPVTRFPLASVTKPITAAAMVMLADRSVVTLTDSVCEHLPRCPPSWEHIRINNLLNHTSGIPQLAPERIQGLSLNTAVTLLMDLDLQFAPGADYAYSNSNFWVAGRIIELGAKLSWSEYLQRAVFEPAQMVHTGSDAELRPDVTGFTLSLTAEGTPTAITADLSLRAGHATLEQDPAGGLVGTVDDLYAFGRALDTGALVSEKLLQRMWTPTGAGRFADYGLGWEAFEQHGTRVVQHSGAMPGFGTCLSVYPNEDLYVVVLSNLQETIACEYVARDLGAIVLGRRYEQPRAPEDVDVPSSVLRRYAGVYSAPPEVGSERVEIAVSGGRLVMRGLASVPPPFVQETILRPITRSLFFSPHDPHVRISFESSGSGGVTMLVHRPGYKRLPPTRERFTRETG